MWGGKHGPVGAMVHEANNLRILARAGIVAPVRPDKLARMTVAAARWNASIATLVMAGAIRHPDRLLLVDDVGSQTYGDVDRRTNAVGNALRRLGLTSNDRVGLMCRDHRGFVTGAVGAAKIGADILLLNTSFAAPQLPEVLAREDVAAIVHDAEFQALVDEAGGDRLRVLASGAGSTSSGLSLDDMARASADSTPPRPGRTSRVTILTSGTTGTPKGAARRSTPLTLDPPASLLDRIPLRAGNSTRVAAPLFHTWGFANFALGLALGATFVLRAKFVPEQCLADIDDYGCEVLVAVPVMLQRILALPDDVRSRYDVHSLRVTAVSGSALSADLATRWMDAFGDNLYNMYGSTEVATATLATPRDMRQAPGTAGKPARGTTVRIYDHDGRPVPQGETGRIFVGNAMLFEGYSGGGGKDEIGGLLATGDVGHFDENGRLFVAGRDDDMIVSGGENVFPKEVEDVLMLHPAVRDAACIGVEDPDFGQRLRAFVVLANPSAVSADELKEHVRANLARFKAPREIVFVDDLPRNPSGKVLKRELNES